MRRLLAFILSALMVLSCCGALFAAADPEPEEPDFYVELSVDGPYFYGEPFTVHAVVKDIKPGVELTSVEFNLCFDENYLTFSGSIYDIVTARPSSAWENLSSTRWDCICVNVSNTDNDTDVATADGDIAFDFEFTCWSEYNYDLAIYVEDAVASDVDFEYHYGEGNRIDLERGGRIKAEDIESVEIIRRDEKIYEGELYKKGLYASYDDDGKPVVWHGDYYDYYDNSITVTLKDGTEYSADFFSGGMCVAAYEDGTWYNNGYRIRGEIYELKYTDDQKKDGPWTAGVHTVHCDFEGFEFDYDVEILESPVVSLTVYPLDIIEGYGRNNTSMYDYDIADWANVNAYEYYADSLKWEAVLNDGTVLNQSASYYNGEGVWPFVTDDQVHEEWTLGNTYAATANVLGCSTGFEVTIIDTPIDHIDIPALRIVEGTHGYADSGWNSDDDYVEYYYYCDFGLKNATVYFKDGSTAELNGSSIYYNGDWYYGDFTVVSDQDADHIWTVGNTYKVSFAVLNYTAEFDVEIIASPFVSATVEPITIMPETGGNWDYVYDDYGNREDYYYYNLNFDVTVELSDGSSITGVNSVEYDGRWYYLDNIDIAGSQYKNHLLPGNTYTGTGTICGLETQISITIAESPIESIEFEELKIPVHSNGWYATDDYGEEYYYYDYGYPEYTVYFKDGSDLTVCGDGFEYDGVWYDIMRSVNRRGDASASVVQW